MGVNMVEPAIVMERLVKKYEDVTAVNDLSLQVARGELFGLLGPNGAGKTTTISILCGLLKPTSGFATVCGYDVQKEAMKIRRLIGVCIQETAVYPYLTGEENMKFFGNLYALDGETLKARCSMLLEKMGLAGDAGRRVGKYSGGMKRRLSLILALIHDPQVVFLDEPTVGMDLQSRHAVWDFIRELKREGKTIILTTHYMEEAEEFCERVGIIDHGRLMALGPPEGLIRKEGVGDLEELFIRLTGRRIREEA
ncbi:MAG: ABC transporter ATP-binding protein [Thermoproteota archaeon]